jgi:hypothetical protein
MKVDCHEFQLSETGEAECRCRCASNPAASRNLMGELRGYYAGAIP